MEEEKEEREVEEAAVLSTFNLDMSTRTLMDLSPRCNDLNVPRMCLTGGGGADRSRRELRRLGV